MWGYKGKSFGVKVFKIPRCIYVGYMKAAITIYSLTAAGLIMYYLIYWKKFTFISSREMYIELNMIKSNIFYHDHLILSHFRNFSKLSMPTMMDGSHWLSFNMEWPVITCAVDRIVSLVFGLDQLSRNDTCINLSFAIIFQNVKNTCDNLSFYLYFSWMWYINKIKSEGKTNKLELE